MWQRCDALAAIQAYLSANVASVLNPDELLRAEWVGRVSALDLFIHEIVAQHMLEQFRGTRSLSKGFQRFRVSLATLDRIRTASSSLDAEAAFDLDVRSQLSQLTFQHPDKIADGIRLVSNAELWNEIAAIRGAAQANRAQAAKLIRGNLAAIVDRRNKIAHEGDLGPSIPRTLNSISLSDLAAVRSIIVTIVNDIGSII